LEQAVQHFEVGEKSPVATAISDQIRPGPSSNLKWKKRARNGLANPESPQQEVQAGGKRRLVSGDAVQDVVCSKKFRSDGGSEIHVQSEKAVAVV
jgi:hypothetical protein